MLKCLTNCFKKKCSRQYTVFFLTFIVEVRKNGVLRFLMFIMSYFFNRVIPGVVFCILLAACGNDGTTKAGNTAQKAEKDGGKSAANNINGEITKADFQEMISSNKHVLVDFYADWCGPCKQMDPAIANITRQYEGRVVVFRINVDEARELCDEMGVEAIPYLVFYKDGKIRNELEGYQREEVLKQNIETIFQ